MKTAFLSEISWLETEISKDVQIQCQCSKSVMEVLELYWDLIGKRFHLFYCMHA